MASIAGTTVDGMRGRLTTASLRYTELEPGPGYDGSVIVFGGSRGADVQLTTVRRDTSVALALLAATWDLLVGTTITVVDGTGVSWPNVLVLRADSVISVDPIGHYLTTTWLLREGI